MRTGLDRRDILILSAIVPAIWADLALARSQPAYPIAVEILRKSAAIEMGAHYRYDQFSEKAYEEGYKGIAYMLAALSTSELIHAQNYERILASLGESLDRHEAPARTISDTKTNLIVAADAEINNIDNVYPRLVEKLLDEKHNDALQSMIYSWETHKQHRDIIRKIQKWSPSFFETVASRIDQNTDRYYVCNICGGTLNELPSSTCPICEFPSAHYALIDQRTFL